MAPIPQMGPAPSPQGSPGPTRPVPPHGIYPEQQTGVKKPHHNDVLCGRGVTTNRHKGNEKFRSLVNCNKELYVTSTKRQKMGISRSIVDAVRSLDPPGRFLEKNPTSGLWFDIGDKKATEKTSQALRDGAAGLRKQLSRDLGDPDFISAVFDDDSATTNSSGNSVVEDVKKQPTAKTKRLSVKKEQSSKGKPPAKVGHRRTKSNPCVGQSAEKLRAMMKKKARRESREPLGEPLSPQEHRSSTALPSAALSPRSPESEHSAPAYLQSPPSCHSLPSAFAPSRSSFSPRRPLPDSPPSSYQEEKFDRPQFEPQGYSSSEVIQQPHGGPFQHPRRPLPPSPPRGGAFLSPKTPSQRQFVPGGSPTCSSGPHQPRPSPARSGEIPPPRIGNQRAYPGGPRVSPQNGITPGFFSPGRGMSPSAAYRQAPPGAMPGWSPRPMHRPNRPQMRRPGSEYRPSPNYHRGPRAHPYPPPSHNREHLAVPSLGGDGRRRMPHTRQSWHQPPPESRHCVASRPDVPYDFSPPPSSSPRRRPDRASGIEGRQGPDSPPPLDLAIPDGSIEVVYSDAIPSHDVVSMEVTPSPPGEKEQELTDSPFNVTNIVISADDPLLQDSDLVMSLMERKSSRDSQDEHPFDEDNPADDDFSMEPLPFDEEPDFARCNDPCSLMQLPENLMCLPISPCGPYDGQ